MLSSTLLPLFTLSTLTLAQTTVQKLFFAAPSNDDAYVGSVVATANGQTTYAVACTSGTFSCITGSTVTITEGPSAFGVSTLTAVDGVTASVSETCTIADSTSATCVAIVSAAVDGQNTVITTTTTLGTADFMYHPVTITAGVNLLGAAAATSGSGSASGNAAAPMVTGMGVMGAVGMGMGIAALL